MKGGPGGRVVSGADVSGHALLFPDLEDLSLVTLSTKTPGDFFSKHQLVLHVTKSEMDKVRVFQDNGESALAVISVSLPAPADGTQPLHTLFREKFPSTYHVPASKNRASSREQAGGPLRKDGRRRNAGGKMRSGAG